MPADITPSAGTVISRTLEIRNQRGLHARAAAKFVKLVGQFTAEITVVKGDVSVSGSSIMGLMMLAASPGCHIRVTAQGAEAEQAMAALEALIASRFGEEA